MDRATYQTWDDREHNPESDQDADQDDSFVSLDQLYDELGFH